MTTTQQYRQSVLSQVDSYRDRSHPGLPLGQVPVFVKDGLWSLVADGTLRIISVTKPSKVDPSQTVTYDYVARA